MDTIYEYPNDNYYKFIIDNYREGNIEYLKNLESCLITQVIVQVKLFMKLI